VLAVRAQFIHDRDPAAYFSRLVQDAFNYVCHDNG